MPEVVVSSPPEVKVVKSKVEEAQPEIVFAEAAVVGVERPVLTCVDPSLDTLVKLSVELPVELPVKPSVDKLVELPVELPVEPPV